MIENYVAMLLVTLGYALRAAGDPKEIEEETEGFRPLGSNQDQASEIAMLRARIADLEARAQDTPAVSVAIHGSPLAIGVNASAETPRPSRSKATTSEERRWLELVTEYPPPAATFDGSCYEQYHRWGGLTARQWEVCIGNIPRLEHPVYRKMTEKLWAPKRRLELPERRMYVLDKEGTDTHYEDEDDYNSIWG